MNYRKAFAEADRRNKLLRATHPGFNGAVLFQHGDGSTLFYNSAFYEELGEDAEGAWYGIFTEHHGTHVYHSTDGQIWAFIRAVSHWWETQNPTGKSGSSRVEEE
jgi:hypothetical protein